MASIMRYRGGVVELVPFLTTADAAAAHAIEVGDLVYFSTYAYPASHLADAGSAAENRAAFAALFVGVASQKTGLQTGETSFWLTPDKGYIMVAASGLYEFDCAATAWATGDLVGVYNDATDNSDQKVAKVTNYNEAIGVARVPIKNIGATTTTVIVEIRPRLLFHQVVYGSGQ